MLSRKNEDVASNFDLTFHVQELILSAQKIAKTR